MVRHLITWDHSVPDSMCRALRMREKSVNYNELDLVLKDCGSSRNTGEVHGLLCSHLSIAGIEGVGKWLKQVLEETDPSNAVRAECELMLDALYATTWRQLVERQSEFQLLLPDEWTSPAARAEAVGQWCKGFLKGLILEAHTQHQPLSFQQKENHCPRPFV